METRDPICWNKNSRNPDSHVFITCKKGGMICGKKGIHFNPKLLKINITAWITLNRILTKARGEEEWKEERRRGGGRERTSCGAC